MQKVLGLKRFFKRQDLTVLLVVLSFVSIGLISAVNFYEHSILAHYNHIDRSTEGLPTFAQKAKTAGTQTKRRASKNTSTASTTANTSLRSPRTPTPKAAGSDTTSNDNSPANGRRDEPGKPDKPALPLVCGLVGIGC